MYLSSVLPWKSSQWTAPNPEEIARIRKEAGIHEPEAGDTEPARSRGEIEPEQKDSLESADTQHEKETASRESEYIPRRSA
jgi:hypothetical protein